VLTAEQLHEFHDRGFTRLRGFDADAAAAMRDVTWRELDERYGITPDGAAPWPRYVARMKKTKRSRAFAPIGGPALASALDQLLGAGHWTFPNQWGQVLVTGPAPDVPWRLPNGIWHVDFEYTPPVDLLFAVKVFAFYDEVQPRGGGTLLIAGSHRMTAQFVTDLSPEHRANYRRTRDAFLRHDPWLRDLSTDGDDPDRSARFMDVSDEVDGVPTRVVELTGAPGDIVLTHPWVYHCAAPNASRRPRFMRGTAIRRVRRDGVTPA
jgi:hypothetical protein